MEMALIKLQSFNSIAQENHKVNIEMEKRWKPLKFNVLKLNRDALFDYFGASYDVLQDKFGQVLLLGAGPLKGYVSVEHAELWAIQHNLN